jgi:hypothetical protein
MKRTIFVAIFVICVLLLTACAASQPGGSVAEAGASGSASASPAESDLSAAFASATASASPSESSLPAAFASTAPSATSVMAGESPEVSVSVASDAIAKTVDKIIDVNALNSVFAADAKLTENGEQMIVGVSGNTLTYNLTFSKSISASELPADFKTTMETTLQDAINQAATLYPNLPDCTFVYNVINGVTGETLLTVTKMYTAK